MTKTLVARDRQDRLTPRPAAVVPEEDRWAYTAEALASLKHALADIKTGYVFEFSEAQLVRGTYPKRPSRAPAAPRKPRKR
ncbi:MAG: hypothetical protein ABI466_00015 [Chloroflexota bacterium]